MSTRDKAKSFIDTFVYRGGDALGSAACDGLVRAGFGGVVMESEHIGVEYRDANEVVELIEYMGDRLGSRVGRRGRLVGTARDGTREQRRDALVAHVTAHGHDPAAYEDVMHAMLLSSEFLTLH